MQMGYDQIASTMLTKQLHPVRYIESMRFGDSKPQKILLSDGHEYIVKFKNNPEGTRILVNDYLVGRLAEMLSLPVVPFQIVSISQDFIDSHPVLARYRFQAGSQFSSRYIQNSLTLGSNFDPTGKVKIVNREALAGIIVFDNWVGNIDRQKNNLLLKPLGDERYHLYMIDHGDCFPRKRWTISTLRRLPTINFHQKVHRWLISFVQRPEEEVARFMDKIMSLPEKRIEGAVQSIPIDWNVTKEERAALIQHLINGRQHMRSVYSLRQQ